MNDLKNVITATGIVIPVEWDTNGKAISFALSSYEEKEYLIDTRTKIGKQLSRIQKQKVYVKGNIVKNVKNRPILSVLAYEIGEQ